MRMLMKRSDVAAVERIVNVNKPYFNNRWQRCLFINPSHCSTVVVLCPTVPSQQIETKIQFRELQKNVVSRSSSLAPLFRIHIPVAFSNLSPLVAVLDAFQFLTGRCVTLQPSHAS